ncbi:hypothetical protein TthHB5018_10920 [Thermus thermophilus]|uniref:ATP-binding protein n=2 Tax=Thermus thermophilus TaxID=274 RepID=A0A7R7YIC4_THETH|nr:hypothetical protein TthHB5018_10920 [Thermus thermophilus]
MALPAWREVALPHEDIRRGRFDESTFAADLADVLAGRGPLEYRDPLIFFRKTYPTEGIVRLLGAVVRRLSGEKGGEPVVQIQTPFGGGKTHGLVALYHLFRSGEEARGTELYARVLEEAGVERIPEAKVAVFVGTAADPLKGRTPWGELALQLGHYGLLEEHDKARQAPGKERLYELFRAAGGPVLILMDEVAEYVARTVDPKALQKEGGSLEGGRAYQTQVLAFFQELTEAVKVAPQVALVMTIPSSAPYGEEGERALLQLQRIAGRLEAIYEPVKGWEIYDVIRTRLFEGIRDEGVVRKVAERYFELYRRLGTEVPDEARDPAYRERMRRAYPFHPELIDALYERWGTLSTFQRTRGVLRFLAEIVADLYGREHSAPLIHSAHVNLANPSIRRELVKHIGNEFDSVIAADIADPEGQAKAQRLDREMGSEYVRFQVASGLATAIFLYSFSGGERKGASPAQLRLAVLRPEVPPPLVGDALGRLRELLWYLHEASGLYYFSSQPNLNRIVVERENAVDPEQIRQALRERLERIAGRELRVYLEPHSPQDVPDTKELKLAILSEPSGSLAEELLEKAGTTFRTYKNTLFLLSPDPNSLGDLHRAARRYLALRSIREDRTLYGQLSAENRHRLDELLREADGALTQKLFMAYRRLTKPGRQGPETYDMGIPTVGEASTLAKRVYEYLKAREFLLERIAPRHLLSALAQGETGKPLQEVYEAFLRYPHLPVLKGWEVLEEAVRKGVAEGTFGLRVGERYYFQEPVLGIAWEEAFLVRKEALPPERESVVDGEKKGEASSEGVAPKPDSSEEEVPPDSSGGEARPERVQEYTVKVRLPWNRLSDFLRGVLMPLQREGAEMELQIELRARSQEGIPRATLDKIRETLDQLQAKVEEA